MSYYIAIFGIIILLFIKSASLYRKFSAKDIAVLGLLIALASAGRVAMSAIPSAQPASFFIIVTGMVLGGGAGYFVGALTAVISNLFLGFGPWLPWQMLLWGLMGFSAPLLRNKGRFLPAIVGFLWGFVFGWIMNIYWFLDGYMPFSISAFLTSCIASFPHDINHALSNLILLFLFSDKWLISLLKKISGTAMLDNNITD